MAANSSKPMCSNDPGSTHSAGGFEFRAASNAKESTQKPMPPKSKGKTSTRKSKK